MTVTHRMTNTPTYASWRSMRVRCQNPNDINYQSYGGRGINVCERWRLFENFFADMGVRPEGMTLDRLDVNQGYSKENCRWATDAEQRRNRQDTVVVEFQGRSMLLEDAATAAGISSGLASIRVKRGIPLDKPKNREFRQLSEIENKNLRRMIAEGIHYLEIKKALGISHATISRAKKAMTIND